jgi:F-type H+-transporting ATPase subunit gamma
MPVNAKAVKSRITATKNTKKITKAMELVSASKMRRAVESVSRVRKYSEKMEELLQKVSNLKDISSPFILDEKREVKIVCVVLISSNRGLSGSFNTNLFKKAQLFIKDFLKENNGVKIHIVGIGKKAAIFAKRYGYELDGIYEDIQGESSYDNIISLSNHLKNKFLSSSYDKVVVFYNHFVSSLAQESKYLQILPANEIKNKEDSFSEEILENIKFEPDREEIVQYIIPKIIDALFFFCVLESKASEESARMVAMKSASDNAGKLIDELNLEYNKARQAAITKELAEIASGAEALS